MDLSAIEQGIKDAIKALERSYIASIETYGGEFDEHLSETVRRFHHLDYVSRQRQA
jgi:phage gp37-like protein